MEAKLNLLTRLELRSLCSKKLLGIPIDSVIKGKRKQFSKTDLIKKILEKGDSSIQSAIDKKKHDPGAFLADDKIASDDDEMFLKSPVKDRAKLIESKLKQQHEIIMHDAKLKKLAEDKGDETIRSFGKEYFKKFQKAIENKKKQDIATKKGVAAEKSFGKEYFKKFQKAIEYKKMTKKELVEFMEGFEESHGALGSDEFGAMRLIEHNKHDDEAKVRVSDIEGKNRSSLEDETIANLRRIIRQKQNETPKPKPKHVEPKKEDESPKKTGEPPKQKQGDILPKKPDEFEKEKAQEDQFKKITRKNVGKIDLSVKVEDDNVKVKPNVKVSDIKKAIQKNSNRLKLSKPPKIVYHSLKNMGKTALLTI